MCINKPLTKNELEKNKALSRQRIYVEHVFFYLKRFNILSTVYRGRICNFHDKFYLLAAIYNFGLKK